MTPINFENNHLICVHYPTGAGGKFLMNCLALTTDVEFQHKDLLNYFSTTEQRYDFFLNKLEESSGPWNDLNLGCIEMLYVAPYYDLSAEESRCHLSENPTLLTLEQSKKNWCMVAHNDVDIDNLYKKIWPNCRIIRFINYKNFLLARNYTFKDYNNKTYTGEYLWDVNIAYSSVDNLINELNKLCSWLNIGPVNSLYIKRLYTLWIEKINLKT